MCWMKFSKSIQGLKLKERLSFLRIITSIARYKFQLVFTSVFISYRIGALPLSGVILMLVIKKIILIIIVVAVVIIAARYLQRAGKGSVTDASTNYSLASNWPQLPAGFKLGNPTGLAIDANQHLVVFHRAERKWPLTAEMPERQLLQKRY